ncbi:TAXI family TRAP transporter solute-binding subunit [Oceanobacillus profundus]|uniref:TAXI family TRAP transporter solute-binding subunit n=1 Tax=Oceanobacillus profundus TaxID=372463 RepID=A0A417YP20_9BACI|nr:TAXI family TRAP transporter solute-binding subunit [Oceanobacillus profundus]MBR3120336.1 TAXI family TRAP transporter solute-binding subunit [Oceanobacillus sp.]PAE30665.1 C4-dicarboxylate ABC transporter substrate-binding protein [Paenibacillus sp. 7884-2]MCM3398765.1 TAXI family TRAP transporter solute-binding subunit [Oceanobacillus profundus]MDO6450161.1 TAXI family TRAP transporter solute-binding subunit [Oceanobacillus profundus]RHW35370.1 TAXI family TRAP transporter solute-binding
MRKIKLFLSTVLLMGFVLFLAACSEDEFLQMLTGGTSGTYYPLGGEMATNITEATGIQTDAVSSNASADNVIALSEGDAELAFVQTDVMSNAIDGINSFEGNPIDNVLAIGALYPETIQIVTTADSGIASVEDLAGKSVSVGAPGSGTYVNAEQILEIHGMTMDDIDPQNLDFGESTGGIQDGTIDAAFITAGTPTGAVEGLSATVDVSVVPIAQDKIDEMIEQYPYYAADTISAGTYGLDEDVNTVAVLAMLAVVDSVSEDTVYDITKAIYENADSMAHDKAQFIKLETALDGIGIDVHPGAQKYYEEEGISVE